MTTAARPQVETDVLVVGSGPAGAAAALFLATYGTATLLVTRYSRLSDSPRALITNPASCSGVAAQRRVVSKRISSSDTVVSTSTCCTPTMPAAAAARTLGRRSSTKTICSAGRSSRCAASS